MADVQPFPDLTPEQLAALDGETLQPEESPLPEGPASVTELEDGGAEIDFDPNSPQEGESGPFDANLVEQIDDKELEVMGRELVEAYNQDNDSISEWRTIFTDGMELLGLKQDDLTEPFPGAPTVTHPLLIESVVKFQAKAYSELFPSKGPVRTRVIGTKTKDMEARAKRVKDFMNYQIMTTMTEFGPELDRLLFFLPFAGSAFKKTYHDPILGRPRSIFVRADDFVINYHASDLPSAERYTHKFPMSKNELFKHIAAGIYRDINISPVEPGQQENEIQDAINEIEGRTTPVSSSMDDSFVLLEMHVNLDLPGEFADSAGIQRPYVVTLDQESSKILAIRRNWKETDGSFTKRVWFTHYSFVPGFGFYGYGYVHLIGGLAKTATGTLRNLLTAGIFANFPAGFKSHGMRTVKGNDVLEPGEFIEVNSPFQDITKSFIPLPFKEPSATLMNLLQFTVDAAQRFADSTEQVISEASNYGPVGTTMALIEASGKLFSAIHKRLHFAQKHDLTLLAEINAEFLPQKYPYAVVGGQQEVFAKDFGPEIDILPVSDPNVPSQAQRISKAQVVLTTVAQAPQEHNMREVLLEMYHAIDLDEPERFLKPLPPQIPPQDPVTENANLMKGLPVTVKPPEDHNAHLSVHVPFLEDPTIQQNQQALSLGQAHVYWHIAEQYKIDMQMAGKFQLPPEQPPGQPSQPIPPEVLNQVAVAAATVADQVLQKNLATAADEQQDQANTDPELQLASRGLDIQQQKDTQDHLIEMEKLQQKIRQDAIDEVDADLDRGMKLTIARLQARVAARKGGGNA